MSALSDLNYCTDLAATVPGLIETVPYSPECIEIMATFLRAQLPDAIISYALTPTREVQSQLGYILAPDAVGPVALEQLESSMVKYWGRSVEVFFRLIEGTKDERVDSQLLDRQTFPLGDTIKGRSDATKTVAVLVVACDSRQLTTQEQKLVKHTLSYFESVIDQVFQIIKKERTVVENLVTSMADAVIVFNTNKEITLINDRSQQLFAQPETQKPNLVQLLNALNQMQTEDSSSPPIDIPRDVIDVVSQAGKHITRKMRLQQGIFEVTIMSVTDSQKQVVGGALLFHDVTQSEDLSKAKSEFIRVASHRLRTPLSSQRWNFELLLGGDVCEMPVEAEQMLHDMQEVNYRMIDLAEDLLRVSDFEEGKPLPKNNQQEINPSQVVDEIIARYDTEIEQLDAQFTRVHREAEPVSILLDPQHLRQATSHILQNALRYNRPKGEVTVTTTAHETFFKVSIKDTGIGISEEDQAQLFTKFFRGKEATLKYTDGTGMGLLLAKRYIESWQGKLTISSAEGDGTLVQFTIPFQQVDVA